MALYGDLDIVKAMLRPRESSVAGADADARLGALQVAVSAYIEEKTGRTFGGGPAAASSVIVVAPVRYLYGEAVTYSTRLFLPKGIRSVTEVAYDPEYDGADWSGGTVIDPELYVPALVAMDGTAMAIESVAGDGWSGRYLVTGTWANDDDDEDVPGEISYIANYLIAEAYKAENTSAAAVAGPDGSTLPLKNPYKNQLVETVLAKHSTAASEIIAI
jgi:hypothetical protein